MSLSFGSTIETSPDGLDERKPVNGEQLKEKGKRVLELPTSSTSCVVIYDFEKWPIQYLLQVFSVTIVNEVNKKSLKPVEDLSSLTNSGD